MHYRVTYLSDHIRESSYVHAPSAASAVDRVRHATGSLPDAFELLSVVPEGDAGQIVTEVLDSDDPDQPHIIA